jgi:hypothetical protein
MKILILESSFDEYSSVEILSHLIDDYIYQLLLIKKDILSKSWSGPIIGKEFKIK